MPCTSVLLNMTNGCWPARRKRPKEDKRNAVEAMVTQMETTTTTTTTISGTDLATQINRKGSTKTIRTLANVLIVTNSILAQEMGAGHLTRTRTSDLKVIKNQVRQAVKWCSL